MSIVSIVNARYLLNRHDAVFLGRHLDLPRRAVRQQRKARRGAEESAFKDVEGHTAAAAAGGVGEWEGEAVQDDEQDDDERYEEDGIERLDNVETGRWRRND